MRHASDDRKAYGEPRARRRAGESGMAALLLVTALMMSMIMAVTISNWVTVQRRGDLQMRVTMKETMLAQSAIQETRFRLSSGALSTACDPVNPQEFTYYVDRSTISIRIDCAPFP